MTRQEAYQILGITEQSNSEQIKKAYKSKAKKYHPDIYQGDKKIAGEKMKQINEAYDLLCKPNNSYSNYDSEYYAKEQRRREEAEKAYREYQEYTRKVQEEIEKIQKESEEVYKRVLKTLKTFLAILGFLLEFYLFKLLFTAIESLIISFNNGTWFLFGLWILWGIMALAGVIFAPIGFVWLMKKAKIFK